jgi:hypothetical protein
MVFMAVVVTGLGRTVFVHAAVEAGTVYVVVAFNVLVIKSVEVWVIAKNM